MVNRTSCGGACLDYAATLANAAAIYAKLNRWQEARSAYQGSLDVYVELRGNGVLPETDAGKSEELAREIVKCEARLAKLGFGRTRPAFRRCFIASVTDCSRIVVASRR